MRGRITSGGLEEGDQTDRERRGGGRTWRNWVAVWGVWPTAISKGGDEGVLVGGSRGNADHDPAGGSVVPALVRQEFVGGTGEPRHREVLEGEQWERIRRK